MRWLVAAPPKVLFTLLATALVSLTVLAVSELSYRRIQQSRADVMGQRAVLVTLDAIKFHIARAESALRGHLLTRDPVFLEPYRAAADSARRAVVDLAALSRERQPSEDLQVRTVVALATQKLDSMSLTLGYLDARQPEQALAHVSTGVGNRLMDDLLRAIDTLSADGQRALAKRTDDVGEGLTEQRIGVGVVVVLNLGFLATLAHLMGVQFTQREQHRRELESQAARLEQQVEARTAELSALSAHLQTSSDREKGTIARDLHDELGGILTSAKIDASWLDGHSRAADPEARARIQRLLSALDEAIDVKRRVIESLRPSLLDHLGLGAALEWYVNETCRKAGLACTLRLPPDGEPADPEVGIAIYRVVQEALTNAVRHARCREVSVVLERHDTGWHLQVADDGVGIQNFRPDHLSHGLAGMRQRTVSMGGRFAMDTAPGRGTRIDATFPLRPAPPA